MPVPDSATLTDCLSSGTNCGARRAVFAIDPPGLQDISSSLTLLWDLPIVGYMRLYNWDCQVHVPYVNRDRLDAHRCGIPARRARINIYKMVTGKQMGPGAGFNQFVAAQILVLVGAESEVEYLKECLTKRGHKLIVCITVNEALAQLKVNEIDLIVTQIHLVNECSFDFLRKVKSDPRLCAIPFAFVRLNKSQLARQIDDIVAKPGIVLGAQKYLPAEVFEPDELCLQLEECLPPRLRPTSGWLSESGCE